METKQQQAIHFENYSYKGLGGDPRSGSLRARHDSDIKWTNRNHTYRARFDNWRYSHYLYW